MVTGDALMVSMKRAARAMVNAFFIFGKSLV